MTTESYGTLDFEGATALPEAIEIARWCGIDVTKHRSRSVRGASLGEIDLLLGFDEAHVHEAVVDANARREHSFRARHFARLLAALPEPTATDIVKRAQTEVAQADALRGSGLPGRAADNMQDPLGAPWKVYRDTAVEIRELALELSAALFGLSDGGILLPVPSKLRRHSALRRRLRLG